MTVFLTARDLADLQLADLPRGRSHVSEWLTSQGIEFVVAPGKGGPRAVRAESLLPLLGENARARLEAHLRMAGAAAPVTDQDSTPAPTANDAAARDLLWARHHDAPDTMKAKAALRLKMLREIEQLVDRDSTLDDAFSAVGARYEYSARSLRRLWRQARDIPRDDWLPALVPNYKGRTTETAVHPRALQLYASLRAQLKGPSPAPAYRRARRLCAAEQIPLPNKSTIERRYQRMMPHSVRVLLEQGRTAMKHSLPSIRRDFSTLAAYEMLVADGKTISVWVKDEQGRVYRPELVGLVDNHSGMIVGWARGKTENADLVRTAIVHAIDTVGGFIFDVLYVDNGRGFANKQITGRKAESARYKSLPEDPYSLCESICVDVVLAIGYNPNAKRVERTFRDVATDIEKSPRFARAYAGVNPLEKPERDVIPISEEEFDRTWASELAHYNAEPGRQGGACAGRSYLETFNESFKARQGVRRLAEGQREMLLPERIVTATAQRGDLNLCGNSYWSFEVAEYAGQKLRVRYNPANLGAGVVAYEMNGKRIGLVAEERRIAFFDEESMREAMREHQARKKRIRGVAEDLDLLDSDELADLLERADELVPLQQLITAPEAPRLVVNGTPLEITVGRVPAGLLASPQIRPPKSHDAPNPGRIDALLKRQFGPRREP